MGTSGRQHTGGKPDLSMAGALAIHRVCLFTCKHSHPHLWVKGCKTSLVPVANNLCYTTVDRLSFKDLSALSDIVKGNNVKQWLRKILRIQGSCDNFL